MRPHHLRSLAASKTFMAACLSFAIAMSPAAQALATVQSSQGSLQECEGSPSLGLLAKAPVSVAYLDSEGATQICPQATEVAASDTQWADGWYVVSGNVAIEHRVHVSGDVHLILADKSQLSIKGGIGVNEGDAFTIYAQTANVAQAGMLDITEVPACNAGIGGGDNHSSGSIAIHGGIVSTVGGGQYYGRGTGAGIGGAGTGSGGTILITGGHVTAYGGGISAAGIGGGMEGSAGNITITGGTVSAMGGISQSSSRQGPGIGAGRDGYGGSLTLAGPTVQLVTNSVRVGQSNYQQGLLKEGSSVSVWGKVMLVSDLEIPYDGRLVVNSGATLVIPQGIQVTNHGYLPIRGTLQNDGALDNQGTFWLGGAVTGNGAFTGLLGVQASPAKPVVKGITATSVEMEAIVTDGQGAVEYGISTSESQPDAWQASPLFTNLAPHTRYWLYARYAGTSYCSPAVSQAAQATTLENPYQVAVVESYASKTGEGLYMPGETVALDAGSREGYSFDGWQVAPANSATLDNPKSPIASFVMPSTAVTLTALWRPYGVVSNTTDGGLNLLQATLQETGFPLAQAVLDEPSLEQIKEGKNASVWLEASDKVSLADRALIAQKLDGNTVAQYLDISLWAQLEGKEPQQVTQCASPVTVQLTLPSQWQPAPDVTRTYQVLTVHDGSLCALPSTYDQSSRTLTFSCDRFSAFAVVCQDEALGDVVQGQPSDNRPTAASDADKGIDDSPQQRVIPSSREARVTQVGTTGDDLQGAAIPALMLTAGLAGALALAWRAKERKCL